MFITGFFTHRHLDARVATTGDGALSAARGPRGRARAHALARAREGAALRLSVYVSMCADITCFCVQCLRSLKEVERGVCSIRSSRGHTQGPSQAHSAAVRARPPGVHRPADRSQRLAPREPRRGRGAAQLVRDVVGLRQPLGDHLQLPDRRGIDGVVICAGRVGLGLGRVRVAQTGRRLSCVRPRVGARASAEVGRR